MNQILSVELPKRKAKVSSMNNKASIKSIIIFFCIVLLVFGIALIGISLYSMMGLNNKQNNNSIITNLPRIDVTQNATELEIEVTCSSEISSIEYNWENDETKKINGNGRNYMEFTIDIPSGTNIFTMKATDIDGNVNEYNKEYVGAKEPNITLFDPSQEENTIIVKCEETQVIKSISYYYDDEQDQEQKIEINNTIGLIKIKALQGEHYLTIKAEYEDGAVGKISKKVFASNVEVGTDGANGYYTKFIVNISDSRIIEKVKFDFNGVVTEEQVNSSTYSKEIPLNSGDPGSNLLKITVYNKDGMVITKKVSDRNRQK